MKLLFSLIYLLFFPIYCFCQESVGYYDIKDGLEIKNGIFLKSTPKGWTFINSRGIQFNSYYKHIVGIQNGVITYCNKTGQHTGDRSGTYCVGKEMYIHVLDIMKQLGDIEMYNCEGVYSRDLKELADARYYFDIYTNKDGQISSEQKNVVDDKSFGYASRNGKFALINKFGNILTDFKYDTKQLNSYTEFDYGKKHKVSVKIDLFTGNELFKTRDSLVKYWNPDTYIIKNVAKKKYYLIANSKKYTIPKHLISKIQLPVESNLFTYNGYDDEFKNEYGFLDRNFNKVEPQKKPLTSLRPITNFYKNRCLAVEVVDDIIETKANGDQFYVKRGSRTLKVINEKFETIKTLPEITPYSHQLFNKYGNLVVDGVDGSEFVIDYNGNYIIPPTKGNTRIKEVYEGLYQVYGHGGNTQKEFEENQHLYNFYNQKGEKLIPEKVVKLYYNYWYLKFDDFKFLACKNFNLILYNKFNKGYGNYILLLDEENQIINTRF